VTRVALALAALAPLGCSAGPTAPRPSPVPTPLVEPVVTITDQGLDPQALHIVGDTGITFRNRGTRTVDVRSDPHPAHTECALMNLGPIEGGQSKVTGKIVPGQGCGYHDERDPASRAFQGFVLAH
jgi:hypothetical protein